MIYRCICRTTWASFEVVWLGRLQANCRYEGAIAGKRDTQRQHPATARSLHAWPTKHRPWHRLVTTALDRPSVGLSGAARLTRASMAAWSCSVRSAWSRLCRQCSLQLSLVHVLADQRIRLLCQAKVLFRKTIYRYGSTVHFTQWTVQKVTQIERHASAKFDSAGA
jgi:hypothetical protein